MSELDVQPPETEGAVRRPRPERSQDRVRRMVEGDLLPRLLLSHNAGPVPPSFLARASSVRKKTDIEALVALARDPVSDIRFRDYLDELVSKGSTVDAVFADFLAPVARQMGTLWEEDECDFFEVTVVCTRIQRAIRRLGARFATPCQGDPIGRVLIGSLEGAQHSLGVLTVAEALQRHGFDVQLGEPFVAGMTSRGFDVFALSVTRTDEFAKAKAVITRVRSEAGEGISIIVGGAAFRTDPSMIRRLGADGWAEDATSAIHLMTSVMQSRVPQFLDDGGRVHTAAAL